jgi:hypothetical protein
MACRSIPLPVLAPSRTVALRRPRAAAPAGRRRSLAARASIVDSAVTMAEASVALAALQLVRMCQARSQRCGVCDAASLARAVGACPARRRRGAPSASADARR